MDIKDRIAKGECLVAQMYDIDGKGMKVGDQYQLNYQAYKVTEIGQGDLEGYIWVSK